MANLKDLIVHGSARILNKIYAKEVIADTDIKVKNSNESISLVELKNKVDGIVDGNNTLF